MEQVQIELGMVNGRNSAELEEPAGAAVREAFNAHQRSEEGFNAHERSSGSQQVQSAESTMNSFEKRIRNSAKVKGMQPTEMDLWNLVCEDLSKLFTRFENRKNKREKEMGSVWNEIYQVLGFFSGFQGLLLTAAAQSVLFRCNNVGFILALSAFATAGAVCGIWQKIKLMQELRSDNNSTEERMKELKRWMDQLKDSAPPVKFESLHHRSPPIGLSRTASKEILLSYEISLLVSVIAFGGLCMLTVHRIVCNPGKSPPSN